MVMWNYQRVTVGGWDESWCIPWQKSPAAPNSCGTSATVTPIPSPFCDSIASGAPPFVFSKVAGKSWNMEGFKKGNSWNQMVWILQLQCLIIAKGISKLGGFCRFRAPFGVYWAFRWLYMWSKSIIYWSKHSSKHSSKHRSKHPSRKKRGFNDIKINALQARLHQLWYGDVLPHGTPHTNMAKKSHQLVSPMELRWFLDKTCFEHILGTCKHHVNASCTIVKIICFEHEFEHVFAVNHHVNATFMKISEMYRLEFSGSIYLYAPQIAKWTVFFHGIRAWQIKICEPNSHPPRDLQHRKGGRKGAIASCLQTVSQKVDPIEWTIISLNPHIIIPLNSSRSPFFKSCVNPIESPYSPLNFQFWCVNPHWIPMNSHEIPNISVNYHENHSKAPQFRLQLSLQLIHPFFQLFHLEKLHQTTLDSTKRWSETLWHILALQFGNWKNTSIFNSDIIYKGAILTTAILSYQRVISLDLITWSANLCA